MFRWIPFAFVRVALIFSTGIVSAIYTPHLITTSAAQLLFILSGIVFLVFSLIRDRFKINPGFAAFATIFLGGYVCLQQHTDSRKADQLINYRFPVMYYRAIVTTSPEKKEKTWKLEASIVDVRTKDSWHELQGKIILYTPRGDSITPLHYGDVVLVKGSPRQVSPPMNPGEFDYKRFLASRNIYHQHYVRGAAVHVVGKAPPNFLIQYSHSARDWARSTLEKYIHGEREQALACALVLGIRDGLDNHLRDSYAGTGSMHVLAVSGLHVGILYWLVLAISKPVRRTKSMHWLTAVISVLILWGYALVTGLSPSVLRAVTMFSFLAIAQPWNKRTNFYNTLSVSAFFILLYDPYQIMAVGFQLSYLAVFGIVALQPAIYRAWAPVHRVWDEIWKISAVAIAAQLATLSLGLLYFHQFPNYFLLSNLIVIPGAFAVLILGLATLTLSIIEPLATGVGWALEWIIKAMNTIVFGIDNFPLSRIENVYIDPLQCFLMMSIIAAISLFLYSKNFSYMIITCALCVAFSASFWLHYNDRIAFPAITIYDVPGHTAVDFTEFGRAYFLADSGFTNDPGKEKFHIEPNRQILGIRHVSGSDLFRRDFEGLSLFLWKDKTILRLSGEGFWLPENGEVDYIIISNNSVRSLDSLLRKVNGRQVILDSSNSHYYADRILSESKKINIKVYSVLHEGAYRLTI